MRRLTDEEKHQAINLHFDQGLTTKEVVDRLGYPTRLNLERWLSTDSRYGGNFQHGFSLLKLRQKRWNYIEIDPIPLHRSLKSSISATLPSC